MKTLTTLLAVVATSFTLNANAEYIDSETLSIGEIFPIQETRVQSSEVASVSIPNEMAWGGEHEGWIPATTVENSIANALLELKNNPPAAGAYSKEVFFYNEMAGEYHLQ